MEWIEPVHALRNAQSNYNSTREHSLQIMVYITKMYIIMRVIYAYKENRLIARCPRPCIPLNIRMLFLKSHAVCPPMAAHAACPTSPQFTGGHRPPKIKQRIGLHRQWRLTFAIRLYAQLVMMMMIISGGMSSPDPGARLNTHNGSRTDKQYLATWRAVRTMDAAWGQQSSEKYRYSTMWKNNELYYYAELI